MRGSFSRYNIHLMKSFGIIFHSTPLKVISGNNIGFRPTLVLLFHLFLSSHILNTVRKGRSLRLPSITDIKMTPLFLWWASCDDPQDIHLYHAEILRKTLRTAIWLILIGNIDMQDVLIVKKARSRFIIFLMGNIYVARAVKHLK